MKYRFKVLARYTSTFEKVVEIEMPEGTDEEELREMAAEKAAELIDARIDIPVDSEYEDEEVTALDEELQPGDDSFVPASDNQFDMFS